MTKTKLTFLLSGVVWLSIASCQKNDRDLPAGSPNENSQNSPYISRVLEYRPAPGQHIGSVPTYNEGDTEAQMLDRVLDRIDGKGEDGLVSLGGFGGYIVFAFDHPVVNKMGAKDLRILGNAYWDNFNPNKNAPGRSTSGEPAIVMVAYDANGNGYPDASEWYELAGSEHTNVATIHNYRITYYRPAPNHQPTKLNSPSYILDDTYVRWEDNQGESGYIRRNQWHDKNSYYPAWVKEDQMTFEGTRIPFMGVNEGHHSPNGGEHWTLYPNLWGYADVFPNEEEGATFDIDWAVNREGKKVHLPKIHFIKVYTAVHAEQGWMGEVSAEIAGAIDMNIQPNYKLK